MKHTMYAHGFKVAVAALFVAAGALGAAAQVNNQNDVVPDHPVFIGGPGPVVAGSVSVGELPDKAARYLDKLGVKIDSCEREFGTGAYEVHLTDGVDIEFNSSGQPIEIEAADEGVLEASMVKRVVPRRMYRRMQRLSLQDKVTSVKACGEGYMVDLKGHYEEALFSPNGELVALY